MPGLRVATSSVPRTSRLSPPDVLRHRLVLSFEAEADGIEPDTIIKGILDGVGVP